MTLKHDWTQHAAHKKYGCMCVVRDFKNLEVVRSDASGIKSLFWKYFFSLLLSVPRSSLVFHFSVVSLFIFTLIWFKVVIKWRKKLEQNSYSLYLCTKNKKDEVEQNISFWTEIISIFLLSSCPSSQLQGFEQCSTKSMPLLLIQHYLSVPLPGCFPVSFASLPGWVWSWGAHSPFPGQLQSSPWTRFGDEVEQEGRGKEQDPLFSQQNRSRTTGNCSLEPPFICPCKCLRFWENRDEPSARFLQESFIRLVLSRAERARGDCVGWHKHPSGWAFWLGSSQLTNWNFQCCTCRTQNKDFCLLVVLHSFDCSVDLHRDLTGISYLSKISVQDSGDTLKWLLMAEFTEGWTVMGTEFTIYAKKPF